MSGLVERCVALRGEVARLEPALLSGQDCRRLVEELSRAEKVFAGARARMAARAVECGAHRAAGFGDAAEWLARATGTSLGVARNELRTAEGLGACAVVDQALRDGELSLAQAGEIARTEAEVPGSGAELVAVAARSGLGALKDEARKRRQAAVDVEALAARQHRARRFRHWRDDQGMVRLAGALEPRVGVGLLNAVEAEAQRIRREARREGSQEPFEAHAADALVALASGKASRGRTEVIFVCDVGAFRRGHAHAGEVCQVIGGGPVPVAVVEEEVEDAFVKAVLHDGVRIDTVAHYGRTIPAHLRTALALGRPPDFEGLRCSDEGCGRRWGVEVDHVDPVANGGLTSYDNLEPKCAPSHWEKTERDRAAGLLGASVPRRRRAGGGRRRAEVGGGVGGDGGGGDGGGGHDPP